MLLNQLGEGQRFIQHGIDVLCLAQILAVAASRRQRHALTLGNLVDNQRAFFPWISLGIAESLTLEWESVTSKSP